MAISASLALASGCGTNTSPNLAPVSGVVELDGQPLAGARVEFNPATPPQKSDRGARAPSGSFAITDEQGYYTLEHGVGLSGAVVGQHTVRISTKNVNPDEPGAWRERVPAKYNVSTQLKHTVTDGENVVDFELSTASGETP